MAAPFTITSVSNYNSNPPSDDGAQTASNRVQWSTQKTKLADPIKTAFDSSETNTSTAFGKVVGGAGITTTAISYTVAASDQGKIVKATASGVTITTPDATVVGSPFVFSVLNNSSGDITLDGNGSQTIDGQASTTVPAGCGCMVNTDGANWFTDGQNFPNLTQAIPQGRLTLVSGVPVLQSGVTSATSIFYTPYQGDRIPISTDGATFRMRVFSELTLTLVAGNHLANTLYDIFVFDNAGTLTIGTGPAWSSSAVGSSSRGTGAGTTELQRIHGLETNKNSMTARNGSTTYTVAANQGTLVGLVLISGSAGVTAMATAPGGAAGGSNNLLGVSNAFNRVPFRASCREAAASWTYGTAAWRSLDNSNSNRITYADCLGEQHVAGSVSLRITTAASSGSFGKVGMFRNGTNGADFDGVVISSSTSGQNAAITVPGIWTPIIGTNFIQAVEEGDGNAIVTFVGGANECFLLVTVDM